MKLFDFINSKMEEIIGEWQGFARTLNPAADAMSDLALRDHARGILQAIAIDIKTQQNANQQAEKSKGLAADEGDPRSAASVHGALRQASAFSLLQLSAEYRALRATVLRLWLPSIDALSADTVQEMIRFNEAIDQALAESIVTYSAKTDETRELFLAILGHDLRAPLSTMTLAGEMLKREEVGREQVTKIGVKLRRSSLLMSNMVADLIGFTRTQLGKGMPLALKQADFISVCKAALEDAASTHSEVTYAMHASDAIEASFDPDRMHQLLTNLLVNAGQYCAPGRAVSLDVSCDDDTITFEVINYGLPIPEDALESIFKPLVQLATTGIDDTRLGTSLGLGLFIAREIAISHGGTIKVRSSASDGTLFTVSFPRQIR
ncbi:MAG: HAMP domain-containing sensor histidine kinase [Pseudomonadota bacterium]